MATIFRVTSEWTGFNGAPGYTNHFFRNVIPGGTPTTVDDKVSALAGFERVHAFWTTVKAYLPDDVKITVNPTIDALEDTNGEIQSSYGATPKALVTGASTGSYSAASGAVIGWNTATVLNRRRIRGRTFLVPLDGSLMTTGGRINPTIVTGIQTAANALAIGGVNSTFGVWARPIVPTDKNPDVTPRAGQWAECTSVRVTDLPAILRSRRD